MGLLIDGISNERIGGGTPQEPRRVLVVDDEDDILLTLQDYLLSEMDNVEVWTASSAAAALRVLESETIHLVITDFRMPEVDGMQLLAQIHARWPRMPTIMMTAFPDLELARTALNEHRVSYFVTKPIDADDIRDRIATALWDAYRSDMRDEALDMAVQIISDLRGDGAPKDPILDPDERSYVTRRRDGALPWKE